MADSIWIRYAHVEGNSFRNELEGAPPDLSIRVPALAFRRYAHRRDKVAQAVHRALGEAVLTMELLDNNATPLC
jgi:hypothetical protein